MRDRLIAPGLAVAAFAVTLGIAAWHWQRPSGPAGIRLIAPPVVQTPPLAPPQSTVTVPAAPAPTPDLPDHSAQPEAMAPQPTAPDPSALPSYEEDQATRNADAGRSARSR